MSRFDYVQYDEEAAKHQALLKSHFQATELAVNTLNDGRAKALVMTKLEEAYMWVGKAIRDDQLKRNGSAPLQEARGNS